MTGAEHLRWAKDRALEYANHGDTVNAINSLTSDLRKHPETAGHPGILLMTMLAASGDFNRPGRLSEFIEGFN